MLRLLIADTAEVFDNALKSQLQGQYLVEICDDGIQTIEKIANFDPDILLLDLCLPGTDGISVIRALRASGRDTKVLVMSGYTGEYALAVLESLGVDYVFPKPCDFGAVLCTIRDVSLQIACQDRWDLENEVDRLLLSLGFRMGKTAYQCTFDAICMRYEDFDCPATKVLYPAVAKKNGGNANQVEKAIRDAIKVAWRTGNRSLWKLYFPPKQDGELCCPTNDEFLARMVKALMCGKRLRLPYAK